MSTDASAGFPRLFSPLTIGSATLKNRIVSSGHDTVMVHDGKVTDQLVAYQEARAAGGAGLIIIQVAGVHASAHYTAHNLMAHDDSCIPGYEALVEAIKPHGAVLFGQLFHPGREIMESDDGTAPVALAPSAVPNERFRVMPRPLRGAEVEELVASYGAAAGRLTRAGLDGVELVASHGYLPAQFLNPSTNLRDDRYGGDQQRRQQFVREVLVACRAAVGRDAVVGMRVSLDEREPSGLPAEEAVAAVVAFAAEGLLDYANVTTGTSATLGGSDHIVPEMGIANGYVAGAAGRLKEQLGVPVIVAGRINQPQDAERILASEAADACVMTRALIADPEMPRRAAEGRLDDIRACIACNQACIGHFHAGYPISCIQHPETGRERRYGTRIPATAPKAVLVVGAGPAGMKAAAVAAERGHHVHLVEESGRPGGQVLLAQRLPGRDEFGGAADNLYREVVRAEVKVSFHCHADAGFVASESPDVVVVATGARPYRPPLEIMGEPWVADAWEVIAAPDSAPKGRIVVVDWRGDWVGVGVARLLAGAGRKVTLAARGYHAGDHLQQYVRDAQLAALHRAGIEVQPLVRPYGMDDDTVYLQHVLTEEPVLLEGVAGAVLACGHRSDAGLLDELLGGGPPAVGVGDCLSPRSVEEAVLEGLVAASDL